jgi:hypothetical protein
MFWQYPQTENRTDAVPPGVEMNEEEKKISVSYEMTDELSVQATRDECLARGREYFKTRDVLIVVASLAIFVSAIMNHSHWIWWIAIFPPAAFCFLLGSLVVTCWKAPREAQFRLAHLPDRTVTMEFSDANFVIVSALTRSELDWSRLKSLERFKTYWLLCLEGGSKIPVPLDALPDDAVNMMQSRLQLGKAQ